MRLRGCPRGRASGRGIPLSCAATSAPPDTTSLAKGGALFTNAADPRKLLGQVAAWAEGDTVMIQLIGSMVVTRTPAQ
jgi:hypothetical protein